jgi:hypothetical protein
MAEVATADISLLSKTIRSSMGEASGEFRKAAANSNVMSKVVKDISNIFNAQRKDIAELSNIMSENAYEAEQASAKMDNLSSLFREMISIQASTQGTMREVSFGIKNLNDQMYNLINSNSTIGTGITGLGSVFNTVGESIINTLKTLTIGAIGGVAGAVGAAGVGAMMGGGGGEGGGAVKPIPSSGSLAQNQQMAYSAAKSEVSDSGARVLTANMSGESLANPGLRRWDRKHYSQGIVQWEDRRAEKIKKQFGKLPIEMTVEEQTKAALWEMKTDYPKVYEALKNPNLSERQKMEILVKDYERPQYPERDIERRLGILAGMKVGGGESPQNNKTPTSGGTSSGATPESQPMASAPPSGTEKTPDTSRALNPESMAGHGHGPISGPMTGKDKVEGSSAIPSGDVIALGKYLQGQGLRISEHPAFGGVNPVHKGRAHYEGRAIDINVGRGVTEASDPVLGAKFDKLAEQLTRAGYKVYWRESGQFGASGHNNHLHAELPSGGGKSTPDTYQAGKSATDAEMVKQGATPMSAPSPTTGMAAPPVSAPTPSTATPEAQAPVTTNPVTASLDASMAASLMGMMGGGMGGMGSIGGMVGVLGPMLASSLASSNTQQLQQTSPDNAELVQALSRSAMNNQMVSEAAVQQQAQQEAALETATTSQPNAMADNISPPVGSMGGGGEGYAYNYPGDNSWPDWASMIGGLHWNEMKNFKKNMWG